MRSYLGAAGRQIHVIESGGDRDGPPLYCLHATAYSGRSFQPLMDRLGERRRVVAPDTPGYGGSDPPPRDWGIADYADGMAQTLKAAEAGPIDLLGYHTGAFIAAEMARRSPEFVRRLVLIGVPYFEGETRQLWRRRLADRKSLTQELAQFEERWDYFITHRHAGVRLERGFDNFVDELRAYPQGWRAHEAAFTFDARPCLEAIVQPTLVLNPASPLAEASRAAAALIPRAEILEAPQLSHAIFDAEPEFLADAIDAFLRRPDGQPAGPRSDP